MKYALLVGATVAYALVALASSLWLSPKLTEWLLIIGYAMPALMGLVNAFGYARRDRLHWAWLLFGIGYTIGFGVNLLCGPRPDITTFSPRNAMLWNGAIIAFNGVLVGGEAWFARIWTDTGLKPPGRLWATLGFLALALALDGRVLLADLAAMAHGDLRATTDVISVITDIISIGLVGPIFTTAVALRGGLLVRPWLFLFGSSLAWLIDDATQLMSGYAAAEADLFMRVLAVQFALGAAFAQWLVRRDLAASLRDAPPA